MNSAFAFCCIGTMLIVSGCATAPGKNANPTKLLAAACEPGDGIQGVKGSLWMKATSQEASGQFPAVVAAMPDGSLKLEVTNLVGATQAMIEIKHEGDALRYQVLALDKSGDLKLRRQGRESWGGIPLRWASELFLGRIPCPSPEARARARLEVSADGGLAVDTLPSPKYEAERFIFHFKTWGGKPWPESLHWERKGHAASAVDFKFEDPDSAADSPRKWEAKSAQGEVKVRWKDREIIK